MREIVLDTETTGLDPENGDRIVEIGCVELINHIPTGKTYHQYINPERSMSEEVIAVHGLTEEFLSDKPKFSEIADDFLAFVGEDTLVIHNAPFDMKFLNFELQKANRPLLSYEHVLDTLVMARQKYPGSRANLNELCKRFNVDASRRTVHGALLDSELLADVYLAMILDKELKFGQVSEKKEKKVSLQNVSRETLPARKFELSPEEEAEHTAFVLKIKNNLWEINSPEKA
ncbi:MAG: DNA polymerase III subunit epsilon [Alphaproteobacteria bacterium]|nr:DNA polymerase III subunit epsilon [Alphaproteobacteria bacterium]